VSELPLHVERLGSGDPLVFLHGWGANRSTWRPWADELARRHELFLVDLKGFGDAPKPADDAYAPSDFARLVHLLIERERLTDVTLIGHSLGGGVALLVALRLLDEGGGRLARLVSVAGVAYEQRLPPWVDRLRRSGSLAPLLRLVPKGWLVRSVLASIVHDPSVVSAEQVEAYARPLRSPGAAHAVLASARLIVPGDLDRIARRYADIDVPALLLWGRDDRVVPLSVAERLARALPRARLVVLDACGHVPPQERPRESLAALLDFLDRSASPSPSSSASPSP